MAKQKAVYQALVGLDFEGIKPPVRVEQGGPIPDRVPAAEIRELLEQRFIRQLPEESEGEE